MIAKIAAILLGLFPAFADNSENAPAPQPDRYFAIQVVDDQTGRGVPMVELQTTSSVRYYTDSAGLIAFDEPGLMDKRVFFGVAAHGYELAPDGFGIRGVVLETKPGTSATIRVKRLNIAERLYRITGQGIYRDTILLGRKAPVNQPLLNGEVTGQDSVLCAVYRGRTFWFYGDTLRLSYALGNFATSGATSDPPDRIDPAVGFDLQYFTGQDGFSRPMAPMAGEGVVWLSGVAVLPDADGRDRMVAYFQRRRGLEALLENGFVVYDDASDTFQKARVLPLNTPIYPSGHSVRIQQPDGREYAYFTTPYPNVRVPANVASYLDATAYEAYTCLKPGTSSAGVNSELERDAAGRLVWAWKKKTTPLNLKDQQSLIAAGKMTRAETPFRVQDETGKPVMLHAGSCHWNAFRKKYIMIACELFGATMLGETWYCEADRPEGPWNYGRKVITHANKPDDAHDFYNPTQHPFFDSNGGRVIYLEGTYVNTFSGNKHPTPYYEYNQVMYRLDLADPRLKLPEP
jgi:hypothetical protein